MKHYQTSPSFFLMTTCLLLCSVLCFNCQPDSGAKAGASSIEKEYFDDYEEPKHKWGFVNKVGKIRVEPIYDDLKDISHNRAAANYEGKWGFLDGLGNRLIDFKYKQVYSFSEATQTFVQDFNNKWFLIDSMGVQITALPFSNFSEYKDGYAVVGEGNRSGLIDRHGKIHLEPSFDAITLLSKDKMIGKRSSGYYIYDLNTKETLSEGYTRIWLPRGGLFRVRRAEGFGFIPENSPMKSPDKFYQKAFDFHYDRTVVKDEQGYALISNTNQLLKRLPYDKVAPVGDNMWKYKLAGKWGLLNSAGEEMTEPVYDLLQMYKDRRLAYSINSKWGYLDNEGKSVLGGNLALVWDFHDGRARFIGDRGVGFIDTSGQIVVRDIFFEVRDFYNGLSRFQTF